MQTYEERTIERTIESVAIKYNWEKEFRQGAVGEKRYVKISNSVNYDTKEMLDLFIIRIEDIAKKLIEIDIETDFRTGNDLEILRGIKKELEEKKILMRVSTYALVNISLDIEMAMKDEKEMIAEAYQELSERIGSEFEDKNLSITIDSLINIEQNSKGPNIVIYKEKDASILVEGEYYEE